MIVVCASPWFVVVCCALFVARCPSFVACSCGSLERVVLLVCPCLLLFVDWFGVVVV